MAPLLCVSVILELDCSDPDLLYGKEAPVKLSHNTKVTDIKRIIMQSQNVAPMR